MQIKFFRGQGLNRVSWTQSPQLSRIAIKAGLYQKAVQVYHIPITITLESPFSVFKEISLYIHVDVLQVS